MEQPGMEVELFEILHEDDLMEGQKIADRDLWIP